MICCQQHNFKHYGVSLAPAIKKIAFHRFIITLPCSASSEHVLIHCMRFSQKRSRNMFCEDRMLRLLRRSMLRSYVKNKINLKKLK